MTHSPAELKAAIQVLERSFKQHLEEKKEQLKDNLQEIEDALDRSENSKWPYMSLDFHWEGDDPFKRARGLLRSAAILREELERLDF